MPTRPHALAILMALLAHGVPLHALEIRAYNASQHDRFTGSLANPCANRNQLFAHLDTSGIGWLSSAPDLQFALVSRQHVVFATHFAGSVGNQPIRFLDGADQVIERTVVAKNTIMFGSEGTDLTLLTLDAPIDADQKVAVLPYLDLPGNQNYQQLQIGVTGRGPAAGGMQVIGCDVLDQVADNPRYVYYGEAVGLLNTRFLRFRYPVPEGSSDEGFLQVGDSGAPTFVEANGQAALVGIHSYTQVLDYPGTANDRYENYDVFLPHYVADLDALMAAKGYRMRPVNAPPTTLSGSVSVGTPTPRHGQPLTLQFNLSNTGGKLTGNVEVQLDFPAGQEPGSVTAPGWVTYGNGSGGRWTLRRALLQPAGNLGLSIGWAAAPAVPQLAPTLTWRSDTSTEQQIAPAIALAPSFEAWANGLAAAGQDDDPDGDGLPNLLEYAFGGDPENGTLTAGDGGPILPRLTWNGAAAELSFPERVDKDLRGLSYVVEYTSDLTNWTTTPPPGISSTTSAYVPDRPGFVRRSYSGPAEFEGAFVRVRVELNE